MSAASFKLLLVCTGNIARSPIAEACARAYLASNGESEIQWEIASAGTHAVEGAPVRPEASRAAAGLGYDLSAGRAKVLVPEDLKERDLILAMNWEQIAHIWSLVPEAWERSFTLKEFVWWAKRSPSTPSIMFPDRSEQMRDKVRQAHIVRKRARADHGFWGGLRPEDLDLVEPEGKDDEVWADLAQAIRALITDSIRLVGGP